MFILGFSRLDFVYWATAVALAVGGVVATLVFVTLRRYASRFHRLSSYSAEEDLPWEDLLKLLSARERELAASGQPADKDLPPEQLLALLVSRLPAGQGRRFPPVPAGEAEYLQSGGAEKRSGRRRWGNPVDVHVTSPLLARSLHGIVLDRSTGGLGIFVDQVIQPGTVVEVRPVEAPAYVATVEVEVKFCRKVRKQFLIGCQFQCEIPWNVRVWFG